MYCATKYDLTGELKDPFARFVAVSAAFHRTLSLKDIYAAVDQTLNHRLTKHYKADMISTGRTSFGRTILHIL